MLVNNISIVAADGLHANYNALVVETSHVDRTIFGCSIGLEVKRVKLHAWLCPNIWSDVE